VLQTRSVNATAGLALLVAAGCTQVKPQADYSRAAEQIRQHVPATQVYDPSAAPTAPPDITAGLTLNQALQFALLANRDLQTSFADIGVARADLVQSGLLKNPMLALSGMFPEGGGRAKLTLGLGQDIADLWQIPIRKKIAQDALDEAILRIVFQAVELTATVKQVYHRVQSQREALEIARANIEIAQRSDDAALARFRAGQVGKIDVDLARTALLQAQLAVIDIERLIRVSEDELALAIGMDGWPAARIPLDPLPVQVAAPIRAGPAVEVALEERTDLLAQKRAVYAAANRVREEWLKIFPSVEISFDLERPDRRAMPGRKVAYDALVASVKAGKPTVPDIQPRSERQREKRLAINAMLGPGLVLPLPIFDQNQAQIAKAALQYKQEVSRYEGLVQRIEKDVRTAVTNYQAAADTVSFYAVQLIPQLQSSLDTATASYRAGESSILNVIEAQRALVSSRSDQNRVQMEQLLAADELERTVGGPLMLERASAPATQAAASEPAEEPAPATQPAATP
jgi:cobalt-zinc-cadmium efflux system outer membrane protein